MLLYSYISENAGATQSHFMEIRPAWVEYEAVMRGQCRNNNLNKCEEIII